MTSTSTPEALASPAMTLVTQTRVATGHDDEFLRWQDEVNQTIERFPGFLDHAIYPPNPPAQVDWVISQRFKDAQSARAWLQSDERLKLLTKIQPILVGQDDIHLVSADSGPRLPAPVTAVISMKVKPGQEDAFVEWQRRIAAAEAEFEGFSGYRLEPPVPGVQDDWTTMLRFDSDEHLEAWLNSEQRKRLLEETPKFSDEFHTRKIRSGFDPWFAKSGEGLPAAWKVNMVVLLVLYPTVFLFGFFVQTPLLMRRFGLPFWLALFVANAVSTVLLGYWFTGWASRGLDFWLHPKPGNLAKANWGGTILVVALYIALLAIFSRFPAALFP
jgi:uncharacterized protein